MAEPESRGHFWIYVWLGVSGLLNLSGMSSIIDGFVVWTKFFRDFIDIYRAMIRQPLAWIGQFIWPFGPIPGWVFDVFVIWMGLWLAFNIMLYRNQDETIFGVLRRIFRDDGFLRGINALVQWLFLPLTLLYGIGIHRDFDRDARDILVNFLLLIATFTLLLFINWQIRQHGG